VLYIFDYMSHNIYFNTNTMYFDLEQLFINQVFPCNHRTSNAHVLHSTTLFIYSSWNHNRPWSKLS